MKIFNKINKPLMYKIAKITGSVIFYTFIVIVLLFSIANIRKDTTYKTDFPNLFGSGFLVVESDSMDGLQDNSFAVGDILLVKRVTDSNRTKIIDKLEIGDIITFRDTSLELTDVDNSMSNYLNTHRIANIFFLENGEIVFHTQGDKARDYLTPYDASSNDLSESRENNEFIEYEEFYYTDIRGVYQTHVDGLGYFVSSLTEPYSVPFMLIIVLPILAFFIFEVTMVIKNVFALKNEKNKGLLEADKEKMILELEAQKEAMRQEILEQIKKEQEIKSSNENTKEDEKK